jgi:CheY-like chemotaxis protein
MGEYILIAETDLFQLSRFRDKYKPPHGVEVVIVKDGLDAKDALKHRGAPLLLLTDLNLPMADGFSVLREVRKISQQSRVVVHSVFPGVRAVAEKLKNTMNIHAVLSKSPSVAELEECLGLSKEALGAEGPSVADTAIRENRRLAVLEAMQLKDQEPPEQELQEILVKVAAELKMPVALVSLMYRDAQWFKAHVGLSGSILAARGTPREWSFCQHIVTAEKPMPLVVPDASSHPLFVEMPFVKNGQVGCYLGAPIITPSGEILGSLCVMDAKPTQFSPEQVQRMMALARRVGGELEVIAQRRQEEAAKAQGGFSSEAVAFTKEQLEAIFGSVDAGVLISDGLGRVVYSNPALAQQFGLEVQDVTACTRESLMHKVAKTSFEPDLVYKILMEGTGMGPFTAREEFDCVHPRHRMRWVSKPLPLINGMGQACYFVDLASQAMKEASKHAA